MIENKKLTILIVLYIVFYPLAYCGFSMVENGKISQYYKIICYILPWIPNFYIFALYDDKKQ